MLNKHKRLRKRKRRNEMQDPMTIGMNKPKDVFGKNLNIQKLSDKVHGKKTNVVRTNVGKGIRKKK